MRDNKTFHFYDTCPKCFKHEAFWQEQDEVNTATCLGCKAVVKVWPFGQLSVN